MKEMLLYLPRRGSWAVNIRGEEDLPQLQTDYTFSVCGVNFTGHVKASAPGVKRADSVIQISPLGYDLTRPLQMQRTSQAVVVEQVCILAGISLAPDSLLDTNVQEWAILDLRLNAALDSITSRWSFTPDGRLLVGADYVYRGDGKVIKEYPSLRQYTLIPDSLIGPGQHWYGEVVESATYSYQDGQLQVLIQC